MKAEAGMYAGLAFALTLLVACSGLPGGAAHPTDPAAMGERVSGFLDPANRPNAAEIIPVAPQVGEPRNDADWAVFRATRAIQQLNPERWALAQADDSYKPEDILKDFSCAMGVDLTLQNSPKLSNLLTRASNDASDAGAAAKDVYKRPRPFTANYGEICIARTDGLVKSFDYPSGHASASWIEGLVLASLAPDRSEKLLARARAYGESRVVCGLHNLSAIEAGRVNGAGVFAALQGSDAYQKAVAEARAELKATRAAGKAPDAGWCAKEAELTKPLSLR